MKDFRLGGAVERRDMLKALGVAGAAAAASEGRLFGQSITKSAHPAGRIDVHHHHVPPALTRQPGAAGGLGGGPGRGAGAGGGAGRGGAGAAGANTFGRGWTPEKTLEQMDKYDISVAILSMTQMGPLLYDNTEKGRMAVHTGNEYGASLMQKWPKKLRPLHRRTSARYRRRDEGDRIRV